MIRDPSDGSVRGKGDIDIPISEDTSKLRAPMTGKTPAIDSGLPFTTNPENLARIERSREWLENYHRKTGDENENSGKA